VVVVVMMLVMVMVLVMVVVLTTTMLVMMMFAMMSHSRILFTFCSFSGCKDTTFPLQPGCKVPEGLVC